MNKKSNIIVGAVVVALVGVSVLGVSLMSNKSKEERGMVVSPVQEVARVPEVKGVVEASTSTSFVASKSGKKYFPLSCGSAKTIKEENRIYFGSEGEAVSAGYEKAKNCK